MTKLHELVDLEQLQAEIEGGFVSERAHPVYPQLRIFNYTKEAQFSRRWNDVTRLTRGLIVDTTDSTVLARPFSKMHNWDEPEAPKILNWDAPVYSWSNKFDGSLGILYRLPNGEPAIATRGSFDSEQARKATELLHASGMAYVYDEYIDAGLTPLFEIIYPENRIVIDYGDQEALVPLGFMDIEHGYYNPGASREQRTFRDLVMDLSRDNAEGWVVWIDGYRGVKIKQADYVELHRIVTGLNRKSIWRALKDGTLSQLLPDLPDELTVWAEGVADELLTEYASWYKTIHDVYDDLNKSLGSVPQKEFALAVQRNIAKEWQGYMFTLRVGKPIDQKLWAFLEPVGGDR